ncbi:MAG: hypothetical protein HUJ99_01950, partial [Bacteroidaceae bacterium]|nr:hypothetical protein [Bacteroidaceae bacterium]
MKKVLMMAALMLGTSVAAFAQDAKALNEEAKALKAAFDKEQQAVILGQGDNTKLAEAGLKLFAKYYEIDKVAQQPDAKGKVNNKFRKGNAETMYQNRGVFVNGGIEAIN